MRIATVVTLGIFMLAGCGEIKPKVSGTPSDNVPAVDNSALNARDTRVGAITPVDQNEKPADIQTTAEIRKGVLKLPHLSVNARNCKIITADGRVTLRGPVESPEEKEAVGRVANEIAGEKNVDNLLEAKEPL